MKRKNLLLFIAVFTLQSLFSTSFAESQNKLKLNDDLTVKEIDFSEAPRNPAFNRQKSSPKTTKNYGSNEDPFLVNTNYDLFNQKEDIPRQKAYGIPANYDLRQHNRVTPVKAQGPNGSCWAFATYGSAESNMLTNGQFTDFSEKHLRNTHGFDWAPDQGGTRAVAAAYLARWSGPIWEKDDPYSAYDFSSPYNLLPAKELKEALYIPDVNNNQDRDRLKRAIMRYGASYTTVNGDTNYTNFYTMSHYNPGYGWQNHAVTIIGWDDDYSRYNFGLTPPGDGAWLVKNSWGDRWGNQGGYYHVSYYDAHISKGNCIFVLKEKDRNKSIWYYDDLGMTDSIGYNQTGWFSNIFGPVSRTSQIDEIGFFVPSNGAQYEIYVNTNIGGNSGFNDKVLVARGTVENAGYTTVKFNPQKINAGAYFAPIVKLTTPGYSYPIPIESMIYGYSSRARAGYNQSFISNDGYNWSDLARNRANANVCLKAFTKPYSGTNIDPTPDPDPVDPTPQPDVPEPDQEIRVNKITVSEDNISLREGEDTQINAKVYPENATNKELMWSSSNTNVCAVDNSGLIRALSPGQCYVTVKSADNPRILQYIRVNVLENEKPNIDDSVDKDVKVQSIIMYPSYKKAKVGDKFRIDTRILPSNAKNRDITWESSDENIASVDNAMVVCNNPGKVKVFAKAKDGSNVSNFAVIYVEGDSPESNMAVNIKSNVYRNSISIGNTNNISAVVTDSNKRNIKGAKVKFTITKPSKKLIEKELTTNYRGQSILYLKADELNEAGTYDVNITATDSKGNTNENNVSFEVKDNRIAFETKVDLDNIEIKLNQNSMITVTSKTNTRRISGADVVLSITDENDNKQEKRFRTDSYGNCYYTFRPEKPGRYYIEATVSKTGYKNSSANTTLIVKDTENKPETKQTVKLKFETDKKSYNLTDTANIKIFATDENDKKIANLKLNIRIRNQKGFDQTITKTTDSNGVATMFIKQQTATSPTDFTVKAWCESNPNTSFDLKVSFGSSDKLQINSIYSPYNLYSKYNNNYVIHNYIRNIR